VQSGIVINTSSAWQGHPDVAYFKGKIYVTFRESEEHRANSRTKIGVTSSEDGKAFLLPKYVMVGKDARYNCPRLSVIDGRMWLTCDCVKAKSGEDFVDAENSDRIVVRLVYTDDGENWSDIIETNIKGIVPGRMFKTGKGDYLITAHHFEPKPVKSYSGKLGSLQQDVWITNFIDGKWEPYTVASHTRMNFCEGSLCENPDGKHICMMRENSQRSLPAMVSFSRDQGRSWGHTYPTYIHGCHRPVLGRLKSGRYLVTYREQSAIFEGRYWARNTFAALIDPESLLQEPYCNRHIVLPLDHDNGVRPDSGYTGWIQLNDGSIYVVNYITQNVRKPFIKWYKFSEKDF
jgi:hypothetical protein